MHNGHSSADAAYRFTNVETPGKSAASPQSGAAEPLVSARPIKRNMDRLGHRPPLQQGILHPFFRGGLDCLDDPLVGSAAAQVAVHLLDYLPA